MITILQARFLLWKRLSEWALKFVAFAIDRMNNINDQIETHQEEESV